VGTQWGRPWSTSWFRATGGVPAEWAGRRVEAVFDLGFVGGWPGNQAVFHLGLDMQVLAELIRELAVGDPRRHEILRALERALDVLDMQNVSATAAAARAQLAPALSRPAHASAHTASAVGHAHIDSAWLWPTGRRFSIGLPQ